MEELNESNQLVNQHCQHRWERGEGGEFHVSTKGKPLSLKKKKEQTGSCMVKRQDTIFAPGRLPLN